MQALAQLSEAGSEVSVPAAGWIAWIATPF